ncbi:MAG: phosphoribosylaminoimidazolesuccinocarboxamide synthase [Cyclobacteriaceae bacterium]
MTKAVKQTDFTFEGQTGFYKGKVRDVYYFERRVAMVATDRISAFDVVLPKGIPCKGQVLNQLASRAMKATEDIVPNWIGQVPDPNVTIGKKCEALPVEMVIRGYLAGHAWREYRDGKRTICGVPMPEGLKENDRFPEPIITPTTKAHEGHDEDISREEILRQGLVSEEVYTRLEHYTRALYARGTELAAKQGLILVDTKYEFGLYDGEVHLIDEVHTPDSSRYFYAEGYEARQRAGETQKQLSKEFVRQWLIENGFQGKEGQQIPHMPDEFVQTVTDRYIELYEKFTGESFQKPVEADPLERIRKNINLAL